MAYKALYRTYRPQKFEEVAGQQHIVKTLQNALATGKIAHAYLFAGPRGTGKTTMAKIFAKALNCEEGIGHQCGVCKNCKAVTDGSHPDILELDAASNNGVDEIRDLIDKVKYGTILGRYKVYIIDEVHMLSTGAFNALLKTLEEPPEHVIFILATTEPHKILPTILSRCQRYDFEKVSDKDIKERIKIILAEENIPYDEAAINLVVKLADGGVRDALSILEKVLAYSGNHLNEQDILDIFSLESTDEKISLLKSINNKDIKDVLDRLNKYISKGSDIKRLTEDLLTILKDVLVFNSSNNAAYLDILKLNEAQELSREFSNNTIIKMIDILMETSKDYKNVTSINPIFEITLLKLASVESNDKTVREVIVEKVVERPIQQVETKKVVATPQVEIKQPEVKVEEKHAEIIPEAKPTPEVKEDIPLFNEVKLDDKCIFLKDSEGEDSFVINDDLMVKVMVSSKKEIKSELINSWKNIKKWTTNSILGKAAGLLIDGRPLVASKQIVILEFPLQSAADRVNAKNVQLELQSVLSQVFNRKMFVYAVSRKKSIELQTEYMNLLQIGQLPKAKDVVLEMLGE